MKPDDVGPQQAPQRSHFGMSPSGFEPAILNVSATGAACARQIAVQLVNRAASGSSVKAIDILRHDGAATAVLVQPSEREVTRVWSNRLEIGAVPL